MMPSGRGSNSRNRKNVKRKRQRRQRDQRNRHLAVAPDSGPILVHAPVDGRGDPLGASGDTYVARCTNQRLPQPPNFKIDIDPDGHEWIIVGPHPRYYEACPACFGTVDW